MSQYNYNVKSFLFLSKMEAKSIRRQKNECRLYCLQIMNGKCNTFNHNLDNHLVVNSIKQFIRIYIYIYILFCEDFFFCI